MTITNLAAGPVPAPPLGPARSWPGSGARLVVDRPLSLANERESWLSKPAASGGDLLDLIEHSGLRGRGGAGFPTGRKWRSVLAAAAGGPSVVVANGEEGEPSSYKDRWLLTHRPHVVLDGLALAARTLGASRAVMYLSHPETVDAVHAALREAPSNTEIVVVPPSYVAGEETAVVRAINGGPPLPTAKPPRPFERGVDSLPTLIQNVETLAQVSWIARHGAQAFRTEGTERSPGTALVTLNSSGESVVAEVPYGPTLAALFAAAGVALQPAPKGLLVGGWFAGIGAPRLLDVAFTHDDLLAAGSAIGCGAITALDPDVHLGQLAATLAAWFAAESSGQCGTCTRGTAALRNALEEALLGTATPDVAANVARWGESLRGAGACGLIDGAANLARSVATSFPGLLETGRHTKGTD